MKMQNAEMEFVAFDAQDVIATSGGLTDYYGCYTMMFNYMGSGFFSNNTKIMFTSDYAALGENFESGTKYDLITTYNLSSSTAYAVTGIKRNDTGFEFVYTNESDFLANNPGASGNNLFSLAQTSVAEVLDWLVANQNLIVQ